MREGDWLTADGTTGADDGVAIAAMMALADDPELPHGPLELLMTVREEVGLEGVQALDGSMVTGTILLNLDSEEDGRLTVGCAGSDTWLRLDAPREPTGAGEVAVTVTVSGGKGATPAPAPGAGSNAVKALGRARRGTRRCRSARLAERRQEPQRDPRRTAAVRRRRRPRRRARRSWRPPRRQSAMPTRRSIPAST